MDLKSYTSEKDNRKEKKKPAVLQAQGHFMGQPHLPK
jgi:hypothetical protein